LLPEEISSTPHGFSKVNFNKWQIRNFPKEDEKTLGEWRLSSKRGLWERAVALLDLHREGNITQISRKIERSCKTIRKWHEVYIDKGIKYLDLPRTRGVPRANNRQYQSQKRTNNQTDS
jgi:hypothetical protein